MRKTLALLRHAKSDWDTSGGDFDRPLNKRGRKDAPRIGKWLAHRNWRPDLILSSPAVRARETIEAVIDTAGLEPVSLQWDKHLYLASRESLLRRIRTLPADTDSVMLVGHNPGLEALLDYLSRDPIPSTDNSKGFTTANLALLRLDSHWKDVDRGEAVLLTLVRPKDL